MGSAKSQRTFIVALRYGPDRRFDHTDDGRQDHDAKQDRCCQDTAAVTAKHLTDHRNQYLDTKETIHNRRNTCQQLRCRFHDFIYPCIAEFCHIGCGQYADRHTDQYSTACHINTAKDHRQYAKLIISRLPCGSCKEGKGTDFRDPRNSISKQEHTDQNDCQNRNAGTQGKYHLHDALFRLFHRLIIPP